MGGFFIFLFFNFVFYKNIFSFSKFTGIYPAARQPGGRHPIALLRDGKGFSAKIFVENLRAGPWRTGRPTEGRPAPRPPGSGAAGPGRPPAGRPAPPPLYKGWLVPPLLICITKIPETKKREGGREAKPCQIFEPATAGN